MDWLLTNAAGLLPNTRMQQCFWSSILWAPVSMGHQHIDLQNQQKEQLILTLNWNGISTALELMNDGYINIAAWFNSYSSSQPAGSL